MWAWVLASHTGEPPPSPRPSPGRSRQAYLADSPRRPCGASGPPRSVPVDSKPVHRHNPSDSLRARRDQRWRCGSYPISFSQVGVFGAACLLRNTERNLQGYAASPLGRPRPSGTSHQVIAAISSRSLRPDSSRAPSPSSSGISGSIHLPHAAFTDLGGHVAMGLAERCPENQDTY